jgi:hypothetical protein
VAQGGFAVLVAGKGEVGAGGTQRGVDGRVDDLVEGFFQRGGELQADAVAQGIERPPLRIVGGGVLRAEFVVDALQGAGLAGRIEHLLEGIPRAGEKEDSVLVLLLRPPCLPVGGDRQLVGLAAGADDDERGLFLLDLNFIGRRQHLDDLVAVAQRSGKVGFQMLTQHPVHRFGVQRQRRGTQLGGEVLLVLEVQAAIGGIVQIPGAGRQFVEDVGLEGGEVTTGALEAIDQLVFAQAVNGTRRGGERSDEDQAGGIRGIGVAIGYVDLFNLRAPAWAMSWAMASLSDGLMVRTSEAISSRFRSRS